MKQASAPFYEEIADTLRHAARLLGQASESPLLSREERERLIDALAAVIWVEQNRRCPLCGTVCRAKGE